MSEKKSNLFERRHYEAIAQVLDSSTSIKTVMGLVDLFEKDNPNFSRERFMRAVTKGDYGEEEVINVWEAKSPLTKHFTCNKCGGIDTGDPEHYKNCNA